MRHLIIITLACIFSPLFGEEDKYVFYIGGFHGPSYYVNIRGDHVLFRSGVGFNNLDISWKDIKVEKNIIDSFKKEIKQIGVWDWESEYVDKNVHDGTSWSVFMKVDGKEKQIHGSNNYPSDFNKLTNLILSLDKDIVFK